MKYVLIRDDDTHSFTPPEWLDKIYQPFLEKGQPVNLSVIPKVTPAAKTQSGEPEHYLMGRDVSSSDDGTLHGSSPIVSYLKQNPTFHLAQHGFTHEPAEGHFEFEGADAAGIRDKLLAGIRAFLDAGLRKPAAFVAPQDRLSAVALTEIMREYACVSCGWYPLHSVPRAHRLPFLFQQKVLRQRHYRLGRTLLLTHTGWILTRNREPADILAAVENAIDSQHLTVFMTHWWEYYPEGRPSTSMLSMLNRVSDYLRSREDVKVVSYDDLLAMPKRWPVNLY